MQQTVARKAALPRRLAGPSTRRDRPRRATAAGSRLFRKKADAALRILGPDGQVHERPDAVEE
eukprot:8656278-Lingulodinium_polyedra.AAC.1